MTRPKITLFALMFEVLRDVMFCSPWAVPYYLSADEYLMSLQNAVPKQR